MTLILFKRETEYFVTCFIDSSSLFSVSEERGVRKKEEAQEESNIKENMEDIEKEEYADGSRNKIFFFFFWLVYF